MKLEAIDESAPQAAGGETTDALAAAQVATTVNEAEAAELAAGGRCAQQLHQSLLQQQSHHARVIADGQALMAAVDRLDGRIQAAKREMDEKLAELYRGEARIQAEKKEVEDKLEELNSREMKMINRLTSSHGGQTESVILAAATAAAAAVEAARVSRCREMDADLELLFHGDFVSRKFERCDYARWTIHKKMDERQQFIHGHYVSLPAEKKKRGQFRGGLLLAPPMSREGAEALQMQLRDDEHVAASEIVRYEEPAAEVPIVKAEEPPQQRFRLHVYVKPQQVAFETVKNGHPDPLVPRLEFPAQLQVLNASLFERDFTIVMSTPRISTTIEAALRAAGASEVQPEGDAGLRLRATFTSKPECEVAARVLHGVVIEGAQAYVLQPALGQL